MAKGPYNELGGILKRAAEKKKKQQAAQRAKSKLEDRTPGMMRALNESGYIAENGLDREDAAARRTERRAFQAGVNGMIRDNEMNALKKGRMYKDYNLLKANQRSKKK